MSKQPEEMMLVGLLEYEASSYGATDYKHKVAALIRRQHSRIEADEALMRQAVEALLDTCRDWPGAHQECYDAITALRKRLESST